MFTRLTVFQASLIEDILTDTKVTFMGLDQNDLPVIKFTDRRRTTEPFAIPRSTTRRGAVEPAYPLRWFDGTELDNLESKTVAILLGSCRIAVPQ